MQNNHSIESIYGNLKEIAKRKGLIYYFELNKCLPEKSKSNFLNPFQPLFNVLNDLNESLIKDEKPLLTSLVVNKNTGTPGKGFFYYAKKLGVFTGNIDSSYDRKIFWETERNKVYKYNWEILNEI